MANEEHFPNEATPEDKDRIRRAALALLVADKDLDDSKFTPPGPTGDSVELDEYTQATLIEGASEVVPDYGRTKTYDDLTDDEKRAARESALDLLNFDRESTMLLDKVAEAGWTFGGGDNIQQRTVNIGFSLPESISHMVETAFLHLPIFTEGGELLPGYELELGDDGVPGMGYTGPIDDKFREVVDEMVRLAQPPETE